MGPIPGRRDGVERSDGPLDFPHTQAATDDAQIALAAMAKEKLPNGKEAHFGVEVEDEAGKQIYRASMNFEAKAEDEIDREDRDVDAAADEVAANLGKGPRK